MKVTRKRVKAIFKELKQQVLAVGLPIPGTIHELYARCGSPTCPCATDDLKRHGPYLRWHYKISGHQYAISMSEEIKGIIEDGIKNREKLEHLFDEMLKIGAEDVNDCNVRLKSPLENRKKS
jgi:hypothetical protein